MIMERTTRFITMAVAPVLMLLMMVLITCPSCADGASTVALGYDVAGILATHNHIAEAVGTTSSIIGDSSRTLVGSSGEEDTVLLYNYTYDVIYNKTIQDPRVDVETLFTSAAGLGIMTSMATLSTISSFVIIYVISRSSVGFGSVYHRIMVGLSTADILQSLAMAFTTLPMPMDMIYEQFQGLVAGTAKSCNIQGSVYLCGFLGGTAYNVFLTFYYLCAITFGMQDATFRKYFEFTLHGITIAFAVIVSTVSSYLKQIHPSPLYTFCIPTAYPYWCSTEEDCLSGTVWKGKVNDLWFGSSMLGVVEVLFLIVIVCSVYIREKKLRDYVKKEFNDDNEENRISRQLAWNDFTYTKSVMKQSLYYVLAYVAVYIFPLIQTTADTTGEQLPSDISSPVYQVAYVLLRPSQGTMNLVIFLHHKIWKLQKQYPRLSFSEALKSILFQGDRVEDKAISSVEIVRRDNAQAKADEEEEEDDESSIVNGDESVSVISPLNNVVETTSVGMVANKSLGSSWMGLSLSAKDGSIQLSSQPSLPSDKVSLNDESSSIYMTKSDTELQGGKK